MSQHVETRTIHTVYITVQDDILGQLESEMDTVEIVLMGRYSGTGPIRLSYRNKEMLVNGSVDTSPIRKPRLSKYPNE